MTKDWNCWRVQKNKISKIMKILNAILNVILNVIIIVNVITVIISVDYIYDYNTCGRDDTYRYHLYFLRLYKIKILYNRVEVKAKYEST
jgi:hypothetical protein